MVYPPRAMSPIRMEVTAQCPLSHAWAAWTNPDRLVEWFPEVASGEPTAGAVYRYQWRALNMELELEVVEVEPPHRLVLRGGPPGLEPQTQSVTLRSDEDRTVIELVHAGLDGRELEDLRAGTESGWTVTLQVLRHYLERCYGTPRKSAWVLGLAPARFDDLFARYTTADGLARWLTRAGSLPESGPYRLQLTAGGAMTGEVLARYAPRELVMTWNELPGIVALRAFSVAPGAKLVGAHVASWTAPDDHMRAHVGALSAAVDRLVASLGGFSGSS